MFACTIAVALVFSAIACGQPPGRTGPEAPRAAPPAREHATEPAAEPSPSAPRPALPARPLANLAARFTLARHDLPRVVSPDTLSTLDRGDVASVQLIDAATGRTRGVVRDAFGRQHANAVGTSAAGLLVLAKCDDERCERAEIAAFTENGERRWAHALPLPAVNLRALETPAGTEVIAELGPARIHHRNARVRRLVAWDAATGAEAWSYDMPDLPVNALYVQDVDADRVLLVARDGFGTENERAALIELDRRSGLTRWELPLRFYGWMRSDRDTVVVFGGRGLAVVDRRTGAEIGTPELPPSVRIALLRDGSLYVLATANAAASDGQAIALDPRTGAVRWTFPIPVRSFGSGEDALFVLTASRVVHALDPETGASRARWAVADANVLAALPGLAGGDGVVVWGRRRIVIFGRAEAPAALVAGVLRGTVHLGDRPARRVPVRANDRTVLTDARGRFEVPLDTPGEILVEIVGGHDGLRHLLPDHKCPDPYSPTEQTLPSGSGARQLAFRFGVEPCR